MFFKKEYHHLDASVYLEAVERDIKGDDSLFSNYLNKLGVTWRGGISICCLGEIAKNLIISAKDESARESSLKVLARFIKEKKIEIETINDNDIKMFEDLRKFENIAHEPELLAIAIAIRKKANCFYTLDTGVLDSEKLREFAKKYRLTIKSPLGK